MYHWDSYLVGSYVHVWTDDRSCCEVHSFAHHMFPEQTIFLFQDLTGERTVTEHYCLHHM